MCSGGFQADSTESGERLDRQRRISLGQVACQFDILSPPRVPVSPEWPRDLKMRICNVFCRVLFTVAETEK